MARGAPAAPRPAARLPLRACAQGLLLAAAAAQRSASAAPADAPLAAGTRGRLAHVHAHALVQQQKQQKQQQRGASQRQVEPACVARAGSLWVSVAADGTAYEARLSGAAAAGGGARLAAAEAAVFQLDWSTAVTSPEWDPQAPLQQRGVRVQPTQAGGCRVTRTYSRGVSTAEELAPAHQAASEAAGGNHAGASTSLSALRWAFEVHGGDERVPLEATTRFSVLGWDGASDEWWAPTDAPAGPLPGETTPPPPWSPRAAPLPVGPLRFEYGGTKFNNHPAAQGATYYPAVVLPIIAVLRHGAAAAGLSLAFDTDDDTTYAALNVSSAAVSDAGGADVPVWEAGSAPGGGGVAFAFERRLLSAGGNARALRLGGELFAHDDCWRPALGRFWARHAEHAEPHPAAMGAALRAEGAATYAYFFGQPLPEPRAAYQQRDLSLNWDAAFPWVYHGVWLPGVGGEPDARYFPTITLPDGSAAVLNCDPAGHGGHAISSRHHDWQRCVNSSAAQLDAWYCALEEATGAASMVYGTLDEFGYNINPNTSAPLPECESGAYEDRLTCGANRLLRDRFPGAQVLDALNGSAPVVGAWTAAIVDVADEGYRALQLENARAVVAKTPSAVGVCLDRGDFVGLLNARGDDGVSMAPPPAANTSGGGKGAAPAAVSSGIPARALVRSFRSVAPEIAAVLHSAGMALFLNADMGHRVDMYASVDGIFDEIGDDPRYRTASAWLASGGLPAAMWCHDKPAPIDGWTDCGALMANGTDADRDAFLQSHLLLGVHPSVPFPDNDHQQLPDARADALYTLYGPLFSALHDKRWATAAHAVQLVGDGGGEGEGDATRANLFERRPWGSGRYALAVGAASPTAASVRVRLRGLLTAPSSERERGSWVATVVRPDGGGVAALNVQDLGSGSVELHVPLARGAAVATLERLDVDADALHLPSAARAEGGAPRRAAAA